MTLKEGQAFRHRQKGTESSIASMKLSIRRSNVVIIVVIRVHRLEDFPKPVLKKRLFFI